MKKKIKKTKIKKKSLGISLLKKEIEKAKIKRQELLIELDAEGQ
jgi:hypothetical protein